MIAVLSLVLAAFPVLAGPQDRQVALDFLDYHGFDEIGPALRAFADVHPESISIGTIGTSAQGRPLWLATVSHERGAAATTKPALFVAAGFGRAAEYTTETALFAIHDLLRGAERDERIASLLRRVTVYVAPCLDPDAREAQLAARTGDFAPARVPAVAFDRNFPAGWHAWERGGGAGAYSLSMPETRAVAEFLDRHRNVSLIQALEFDLPPARSTLPAGARGRPLGELDRAIYRRLDGAAGGDVAAGFRPFEEERALHPGGGLLEFGQRHLGAFGFVTDVWESGTERPPVFELTRLGRRTADALRTLARQLPYLLLDEPRVTKLRASLWQLDVAIRNVGTLPSLSSAGSEAFAGASAHLRLEGQRVLAAAVRRADAQVFRVVGYDPGGLALSPFEGGEERTVRFVVEGADDPAGGVPAVSLVLESTRAGSAVVQVPLR